MAKLRRQAQAAYTDDSALRLRAAWLYHGYGLTQNAVAEQLGIGRSTVIRLLDEARARGEVRITIAAAGGDCEDLAVKLERALGLDEAIVVPGPRGGASAAAAVGLALGRFLSDTIADGMTIGAGWGRTLSGALAGFSPPKRSGVKVMSLLGGAVETEFANPFEFAWRLAAALQAECFLFPAPLVVDSAETRRRLMEACGLSRLRDMASSLDIAVVSAGSVAGAGASLAHSFVRPEEARELTALGCVGDVMCTFLDRSGVPVPHPLNARTMSVGLDAVKAARHVVLAGGGEGRAAATLAAVAAIGCHTLVTDEHAARAILALAGRG